MKILIVDDDKTTRKLLSLYLKSKGYDIVTAENGLDAMEKLGAGDVNLIVTDMNMPYMDGIELTKTLKAADSSSQGIPIIMVTTEADSDEREKALGAGVDDYLVKPTNADQISESVKRILKKFFIGGEGNV